MNEDKCLVENKTNDIGLLHVSINRTVIPEK